MSDEPKPGKPAGAKKIPDGSVYSSDREHITLHLESIKSVGLENLVDVEVHTINSLFNSVSHYIKFFGGGEVRFSYNAKGEILEFEASNVQADIRDGERILLRKHPAGGKPG